VLIQSFVPLIQIRRFTRLHSLCWLAPSTFIPPSFRLSVWLRSKGCPHFWDFRCSALLGLPLLRTSGTSVAPHFWNSVAPHFWDFRCSALPLVVSCFHTLIQSVDVSINQVSSPLQLNPQLLNLRGFPWMFGPSAYE
jgi:hypothetical protein